MWQIDGETMETWEALLFLSSKIIADGDCSHEIKRYLLLGRKAMTNLDNILKSRDITLSSKVCLVKAMVFPVVMYGCENWIKESWTPKNWCFWTVVLEKTLESPLDCKEMTVLNIHRKDWCWNWNSNIWPPDARNWRVGKDTDSGKDWRQEEKETTEDKMVGWHHWLNGQEFE